MDCKKTIMIMAVAMFVLASFTAVAASDDSDAVVEYVSNDITAEGFKENSTGTLKVPLKNVDGEACIITLAVTNPDQTNVYKSVSVNIPADEEIVIAEISFSLGAGTHSLLITGTPEENFPEAGGKVFNTTTFEITVEKSIWSNITTYLAIAVIVILIVIAVFLKMRSAPAVKPSKTFTDLERERQGADEVQETKPARKSGATERKKYKAEAPEKSEKTGIREEPAPKATSFTDLEKQKTSEKPEKKDSEPKKLKYVSSRRK